MLKKTCFILYKNHINTSSHFTLFINNTPITQVTEAPILGITIDENLTFKTYCSVIRRKLASSVFIFSKIRHKIPLSSAWSLYHSLFKSHLAYCITIWGNTCDSFLHPLNVLHNKFLRTLLCVPRSTHVPTLYTKASALTLANLYIFSIAILIYKYFNLPALLPPTLNSIFNPTSAIHSYSEER